MSKAHLLYTIGLAAGVTLISASAVAAQGCQVCDDTYWSDPQCVTADWTERGTTDCEVEWAGCKSTGSECWGPDPESAGPVVTAFTIRADGTIRGSAVNESGTNGPILNSVASSEQFTAEALGFSAEARLHTRNCKRLIIARVFGDAVRSQIIRESEVLVL